MKSTRLLREYLKIVIREGSTLTAGEMAKRPGRFDTFLSMMMNGKEFQTDAGEVTISHKVNRDLVAALRKRSPAAYAAAFAKGVTTSTGVLKSAGSIKKTKEFGGRGDSGSSAAGLNESVFADKVKALVAAADGPITVVLGQKVIPDVTDAEQTGTVKVKGGQTSKADVVLKTLEGQVRLSIKMKTAEYYLSGDAQLAQIVGPIVKDLLAKNRSDPPVPSIQKIGPRYFLWYDKEMVSGISFPISPELAQSSVFGEGDNTVDVVVKGDLAVDPVPVKNGDTYTYTYTWSDVKTYETLESLPDADQPVGLLRTGEAGRGFTYNKEKYSGIRPAIVSKKRARSAYHYVP